MNINYIVGIVGAFGIFLLGCVLGINIGPDAAAAGLKLFTFTPKNLWNFFDAASIFITIGCTLFIVAASFPGSMLKAMPKHFKIILNNKLFDPKGYIEQLVELAQIARKNGLLSLEEKANEQSDPFFKQAIMLIVDANDPDRVRATLENDIECMSDRHNAAAALYDKASAVSPAFGMVGTLVGLINMLKQMDPTEGSSDLGANMSVALITTFYGCLLAHMIFGPVANNLRIRDSEEVLNKMIIVEGITCIQAGENPKMLREKLLTFVAQKQREKLAEGSGSSGGEG